LSRGVARKWYTFVHRDGAHTAWVYLGEIVQLRGLSKRKISSGDSLKGGVRLRSVHTQDKEITSLKNTVERC
jgi:hypothetical protein